MEEPRVLVVDARTQEVKQKPDAGALLVPEAAAPAAPPVPQIEVFPVLRADVVPYARKRCGMCFGKGEFNEMIPTTPQPNPVRDSQIGKPRYSVQSKLCGCALRRFLTARPLGVDVVQMKDKSLAWRPGREPQHWRDEVQALAQARTAEASTLQPATVPETKESEAL